MKLITRTATLALLLTTGCADVDDHDHDHDHGLATTVVLSFIPDGGGDTLTFAWSDPENDGDPEVDEILLPDASNHNHHDAQQYTLNVEIWNELERPSEDVTPEIDALSGEHQLFFTGSAVDGPATADTEDAVIRHRYGDLDPDGLPVGLTNTITTLAWGSGDLEVTLRHMPEENGQAVKVEGLARDVADDGFGAIGGDNDIQVTFPIEVR
jgi:hypothetical protein